MFGDTLSEKGNRRRQDTEQKGFQVEGIADAQTQRHEKGPTRRPASLRCRNEGGDTDHAGLVHRAFSPSEKLAWPGL